MDVVLIRHGETQGNRERRYIGSTDEPLCAAGEDRLRALAKRGVYPPVQQVYVSPLRRCLRTAELLYPDIPRLVTENLREQAFGAFENRSYEELQFLPAYRNWLETAGEGGIPQGESGAAFRARCRKAFCACVEEGLVRGHAAIAVVAHGGVLMAILSEYGRPVREFYGWQIKNGHGFLARVKPEHWARERAIIITKEIAGEENA